MYLLSTGGVALLVEVVDPLDLFDRTEPVTEALVAGGDNPKAAW